MGWKVSGTTGKLKKAILSEMLLKSQVKIKVFPENILVMDGNGVSIVTTINHR